MKAIRVKEFGPPQVMEYEDIEDPILHDGELIIRAEAIGVNPVDVYHCSGTQGYKPKLPFTPGFEAAGIVESIGGQVTMYKPGDRVYVGKSLSGTYAEKILCSESQVRHLPDNVSFDEGASIGIAYATAYRALVQKAKAKAGDVILIHGASGGVGLAILQLARMNGISIIATAGSDKGLMLIQQQGAHLALRHDMDSYMQQIKLITKGYGVDIIFEMLANVNLGNDLELIAHEGKVIIIGNRGEITINPRMTMKKDVKIIGMSLLNASPDDLARIHAALYSGLKIGSLKPVIGNVFALKEAVQAHEYIINEKAAGKVILKP